MLPLFDPRHEACKQPYGAVACGSAVTLTLHAGQEEDFVRCTLLCRQDFAAQTLELSCEADALPPYQRFTLTFAAPAQPELLWYAFRFTRRDGSAVYLGKNGLCRQEEEANRWQLTVYAPSHTPDWFGKGVTYQIFPDRFRRLAVPDPQGLVGNRTVHQDWYEGMVYLPNEQGRITNSDFFGGSLPGITEKLDYLAGLGVSTLYLCPIFESASNHRYDTADYSRIDPMLGTEADFTALCDQAAQRGIRVILDGVFNHTGSNSIYFNREGFYPRPGAFQSTESPYFGWYSFRHWPQEYEAWWGVDTLPAVNETSQDYVNYIAGENGILRRWLRAGASGWRLDVADELTDPVLDALRSALEAENPDALLLGEVWEDGSNKIAYSRRRRYLLGRQCHGLMNYPFRTAMLAWLLGGDAAAFREEMETLRENYPPEAFYSAMNFLGTHDTPRILTVLGAASTPDTRPQRAAYRLSAQEWQLGMVRLRLAALLLYTFPGSPTLYYGDETGLQGFEDPFNRGTFPWGREDLGLTAFFAALGRLRQGRPSLQSGTIDYLVAEGGLLVFRRQLGDETTLVALNASPTLRDLVLPCPGSLCRDGLSGQGFLCHDGQLLLTLPAREGLVLLPE